MAANSGDLASDDSSRNVGAPLDVELDADGYQNRANVFLTPAPREVREGEKAEKSDASEKLLETVCTKLRVKEFKRIGVRQWFAADLDKPFALGADQLTSGFSDVGFRLAFSEPAVG